MRLANDVSRCFGEIEEPAPCRDAWIRTICHLRDTCARYVQRNTGGERTPTMAMICHHEVDAYIRQEWKNDQRDS